MADIKPRTVMHVGDFGILQLDDSTFGGGYKMVHVHSVEHAINLIIKGCMRPDLVMSNDGEESINSIIQETAFASPGTTYALMVNEDPTQEEIGPGLAGVMGITTNAGLGVLKYHTFMYNHLARFKQPENTDDLRKVIDYLIDKK